MHPFFSAHSSHPHGPGRHERDPRACGMRGEHHHHHFASRGGEPPEGRGGFGRHGGHRGDGHGHRGGPRGGRALGHGDLKLLLLALIEQQPRHGYELIRTITGMFNGQYTPSPGSIYPTLTLLEEMELVESEAGTRKQYSITAAGRQFLADNRELVDAVMARTRSSARMAARMSLPQGVRDSMEQLKQALLSPMAGGSEAGWSEDEAQRVADIVVAAAARILQGRTQD